MNENQFRRFLLQASSKAKSENWEKNKLSIPTLVLYLRQSTALRTRTVTLGRGGGEREKLVDLTGTPGWPRNGGANPTMSGSMLTWRRKMVCTFGSRYKLRKTFVMLKFERKVQLRVNFKSTQQWKIVGNCSWNMHARYLFRTSTSWKLAAKISQRNLTPQSYCRERKRKIFLMAIFASRSVSRVRETAGMKFLQIFFRANARNFFFFFGMQWNQWNKFHCVVFECSNKMLPWRVKTL